LKKLLLLAFCFLSPIFLLAQLTGLDLLKGKTKIELNFEFENGFILIPIKYNNFVPLNFILDTGAEHVILFDKELNDLFGIGYDKRVEILGSDFSQTMYALIARNVPIKIENNTSVKRDIIVLEDDQMKLDEITGLSIDGILGGSFFKNLVVQFNFDKEILTLYHPNHFNQSKTRKFSKIPIEIHKSKPYIETQCAINQSKSDSVLLLIDTGASLPFLLHEELDSNLVLPNNIISGNLGRGIGGVLEGFVTKIPKVSFDDLSFHNPICFFQKLNHEAIPNYEIKRDGIIGTNVLSRFEVFIDYLRGDLYLKPNKRYKKPFAYDKSGMVIYAFGPHLNQFYVKKVLSNSPAEKAGIEEGDVLKRMGLFSLRHFSLSYLTKKLSSKEGKRIKFRIDRNGEKIKTELVLEDFFRAKS